MTRHDQARPRNLAPGVLASLCALLLALAAPTSAGAQVNYSRSPETVVIRLQETLGELADGDRGPSIEIRGDGTAHVHYPAFMRRAGDYTTQLGAAEMDRLMAIILEGGLLDFDAAAARRAKAQNARARTAATADGRPTRHVVLDASTTILEIDVGGRKRTIRWYGLRSDARRYGAVAAIQGLAQAQRELLSVMERDDLTRVTR